MSEHYRFKVQPILVGPDRQFQLRVGMEGETDLQCIPVHSTAFAMRMELKLGHETEAEAHQEKDALLDWLRTQQRSNLE